MLNAAAATLAERCTLLQNVYVHLLFWHVSLRSASRNRNVDYEPFISQLKLPEISWDEEKVLFGFFFFSSRAFFLTDHSGSHRTLREREDALLNERLPRYCSWKFLVMRGSLDFISFALYLAYFLFLNYKRSRTWVKCGLLKALPSSFLRCCLYDCTWTHTHFSLHHVCKYIPANLM